MLHCVLECIWTNFTLCCSLRAPNKTKKKFETFVFLIFFWTYSSMSFSQKRFFSISWNRIWTCFLWSMYYNTHYHHRWTLKSVVSHIHWYWMHITRYLDLISVGNGPEENFPSRKKRNIRFGKYYRSMTLRFLIASNRYDTVSNSNSTLESNDPIQYPFTCNSAAFLFFFWLITIIVINLNVRIDKISIAQPSIASGT